MIFETRINDIPCQCKVLDYQPYIFSVVYGTGTSDVYPPEEEFFDYEILDINGRKASWLSKQLKPGDDIRLKQEFLDKRSHELFWKSR